jgi:hypothetical protein
VDPVLLNGGDLEYVSLLAARLWYSTLFPNPVFEIKAWGTFPTSGTSPRCVEKRIEAKRLSPSGGEYDDGLSSVQYSVSSAVDRIVAVWRDFESGLQGKVAGPRSLCSSLIAATPL